MGNWTHEEDQALIRLHGEGKMICEIAEALDRSKPSVRAKITRLGIAKKAYWSKQEEKALIDLYEAAGKSGYLGLRDFAKSIGKSENNISRKASLLGLNVTLKRQKVKERRPRERMYATKDDLRKGISERVRRQWKETPHPRGMKGKKHSAETKEAISRTSRLRWESMTKEEKDECIYKIGLRGMGKDRRGSPKVARGSWAAGWREIGGKQNYYRSRWEANYARYLEWLKTNGEIKDWAYEPETFWFEKIRRGVRSYKPDFRVWETCGGSDLHEVKGWMCSRSKTTLSRMAKYYPQEKIVLIEGAQYRAISRSVSGLIDGWE